MPSPGAGEVRKLSICAMLLVLPPGAAFSQVMRGRVVMPDGSAPPQRAIVERMCLGGAPIQEAVAGKRGEFFWRVPTDSLGLRRRGIVLAIPCYLRARVKDMESDALDIYDPRVLRNLELPPLVLRRPGAAPAQTARLPDAALKPWQSARNAYTAERWAEAERLARSVTQLAPEFAPAWMIVGGACFSLDRLDDAREAFQRAIAADNQLLTARLQLVRVELSLSRWPDADRAAAALIDADPGHRYPEAHLDRGIARQMLGDRAGAESDWRTFLQLAPASPKADAVKARLLDLERETTAAVQDLVAISADELESRPVIEAWVPGGRKALAAIARLASTPEPAVFFLEYCRAIAAQTSRLTDRPAPGFLPALQAYLTSVPVLAAMGVEKGGRVVVTISPADPNAARALALLGWKIEERDGAFIVEPGDHPLDASRQQAARALGVDEFDMREALQGGRPFRFEMENDTAPVVGGVAWNGPLAEFSSLSGGIAEAFVRDPRLARTYAGLAAMQADIALGLIRSPGLRSLSSAFSDTLWRHGGAVGRPLPGGPAADLVWTSLAGAAPREPVRFAEALLRVDRGALASFYAAVARADDARQKFITGGQARAAHLYRWFRGDPEARAGVLASLPVDEDGAVRFPGGRAAWSAAARDDDALWTANQATAPLDLEALAAVADLERRRGTALDAISAKLLAINYRDWRPLFPYFVSLPRLGAEEFTALAALAGSAAPSRMGQWYAAAELIVLGREAGSLDDAAAARAFGRLCRSGDALGVVRELAGGAADLDEAVAAGLLRLSGPRREAYDRIRELQQAPRLSALSADPGVITAALVGAVYAARLDPRLLILHEDRELLRRHDFAPGPGLFAPAKFVRPRFSGGLMSLAEAAAALARVGSADAVPAGREPDGGSALSGSALFHASARLVEIHAAVTDERGRPIDRLRAEQFAASDEDEPVTIAAFEDTASPLSCALLLDTSLSMDGALAALKSAAFRLIGGLRAEDTVAVYSLTGGVSELQPFTAEKTAARRAVLGAELGELTALYDGLVRVNRDLAARTGKKAVVVFTDGEDTASALDAQSAILRAKTAGVPIYTIAQGHAVRHADLLQKLAGMSEATGGLSFSIRSAAEIGPVFDRVLQDLLHGYLLAFSPSAAGGRAWRKIDVRMKAPARGRVRARQGYYPE